jgi:hypothetical protein
MNGTAMDSRDLERWVRAQVSRHLAHVTAIEHRLGAGEAVHPRELLPAAEAVADMRKAIAALPDWDGVRERDYRALRGVLGARVDDLCERTSGVRGLCAAQAPVTKAQVAAVSPMANVPNEAQARELAPGPRPVVAAARPRPAWQAAELRRLDGYLSDYSRAIARRTGDLGDPLEALQSLATKRASLWNSLESVVRHPELAQAVASALKTAQALDAEADDVRARAEATLGRQGDTDWLKRVGWQRLWQASGG